MIFSILSPQEVGWGISKQAQARRLSLDLSQKTLSDRSGVSLGVIKKFERSGKISLESLLKLALVLGGLQNFENLFQSTIGSLSGEPKWTSVTNKFSAGDNRSFNDINHNLSLDDLFKDKKRKRGRQ